MVPKWYQFDRERSTRRASKMVTSGLFIQEAFEIEKARKQQRQADQRTLSEVVHETRGTRLRKRRKGAFVPRLGSFSWHARRIQCIARAKRCNPLAAMQRNSVAVALNCSTKKRVGIYLAVSPAVVSGQTRESEFPSAVSSLYPLSMFSFFFFFFASQLNHFLYLNFVSTL